MWTGAENLATLGFDPRTALPVVSRYTDWAVLAHHHVPGIASKHAVTGHSFLHAIFKCIHFFAVMKRHLLNYTALHCIMSRPDTCIPVSLSKPHYSKSSYLRNVGSSLSNCMTSHSDNLLHCLIPWNPQMQGARRKIIILMSKYFAVSVRSMLDVVWNVQDKWFVRLRHMTIPYWPCHTFVGYAVSRCLLIAKGRLCFQGRPCGTKRSAEVAVALVFPWIILWRTPVTRPPTYPG
jgi:hypothetical protein